MTIVADYIVIEDDAFTLSADQEHSFEFELPAGYHAGTSKQRPILAYIANPDTSEEMVYQIDLNGQQVVSESFTSSQRRGTWEVVPGEELEVSGQNVLQFRVESGSGSITFRDVVLWFQVTM